MKNSLERLNSVSVFMTNKMEQNLIAESNGTAMLTGDLFKHIIQVLNQQETRIADLEFEIVKLTGKVETDDEI